MIKSPSLKNSSYSCYCGNKFEKSFATKDFRYFTKGEYSYLQCSVCGIYKLKNTNIKYPKTYYSFKFKEKTKLMQKFTNFLYNLFFNKSSFFLRTIFLPFKPFLRGTIIKQGASILDVGCGSGNFLSIMHDLGMKTCGIEPSLQAVKSAPKKLNIINSTIHNSKLPKRSFDVITMNHVFEHSDTPFTDIKKIKTYLKHSGTLILATPNTRSLAFKLFGKYWVQVSAPWHAYLFSNNNLISLLEKEGFSVKKIRYNSMPFQFLGSLSNYIYAKTGKTPKILSSRLFFYMFLPICFFLNFFKFGDQFEIWLEKKTK
ncbi:MAG: class I SAM-dependent methyltransferase [Nanoarchaeota archaeon]